MYPHIDFSRIPNPRHSFIHSHRLCIPIHSLQYSLNEVKTENSGEEYRGVNLVPHQVILPHPRELLDAFVSTQRTEFGLLDRVVCCSRMFS